MNKNDGNRRRGYLMYGGAIYLVVSIMCGILGGVGVFTFGYAQGASYLSNDPTACTNCHVMDQYFESWEKSSHQSVAVCNDCHLSHNPIGKWITKADNGFFHSLAFTTGEFHEPIRIKPRNRRVTQQACLYCHKEIVHQMLPATQDEDMLQCVTCHSDVGHAQRR